MLPPRLLRFNPRTFHIISKYLHKSEHLTHHYSIVCQGWVVLWLVWRDEGLDSGEGCRVIRRRPGTRLGNRQSFTEATPGGRVSAEGWGWGWGWTLASHILPKVAYGLIGWTLTWQFLGVISCIAKASSYCRVSRSPSVWNSVIFLTSIWDIMNGTVLTVS